MGRKTTNFSITCYTRTYGETKQILFRTGGFYVLVEWGWNTRDEKLVWRPKIQGENNTLYDGKYINQKYLLQKRISSNFEYDVTLGLTTNGGVKFGDNETFILDVQLTSQGEVG